LRSDLQPKARGSNPDATRAALIGCSGRGLR